MAFYIKTVAIILLQIVKADILKVDWRFDWRDFGVSSPIISSTIGSDGTIHASVSAID